MGVRARGLRSSEAPEAAGGAELAPLGNSRLSEFRKLEVENDQVGPLLVEASEDLGQIRRSLEGTRKKWGKADSR
ncbi:hypothetical protein CDL15_Pgr020726 [Punica granatum]|uniref:Uncharacterized protein n=1 Tax=Punica granatum TaxID=22663 RepID=A0A218Y0E9_PUNGR|nr:hypothetical protein CDL15_Pgr020726 [Punica granatum]PKI55597.1 hypothetical protein CRG98_023990 [Punica granatum]